MIVDRLNPGDLVSAKFHHWAPRFTRVYNEHGYIGLEEIYKDDLMMVLSRTIDETLQYDEYLCVTHDLQLVYIRKRDVVVHVV